MSIANVTLAEKLAEPLFSGPVMLKRWHINGSASFPAIPRVLGADGVTMDPNVLKVWAGSRVSKCGKIVSDP